MTNTNLSFLVFYNRSLVQTMDTVVHSSVGDEVELVEFLQKMCISLTKINPFYGFMTSTVGTVQYPYTNENFVASIIEFNCSGNTVDEVIGAFKTIIAENIGTDGVLIPYYVSISRANPSAKTIFDNDKYVFCVEVCGFFGEPNNITD